MKSITRGYFFSIAASILFALLTIVIKQAEPIGSLFVTAWRIVGALPLLIVLLMIKSPHEIEKLRLLSFKNWLLYIVPSACVIGIQFGLFAYAPLHNQGVALALGYLLVPMVLVFIGIFLYKEKLTSFQYAGLAMVMGGILHEALIQGIGEITVAVVLGMPLYFLLHKKSPYSTMQLITAEMATLFPIAGLVIASSSDNWRIVSNHPSLWLPLIMVGIITALAYKAYLTANKTLTYSLFGILSYLEPVLLLVVAFVFGETISVKSLTLTYLPILVGALVVSWPKHQEKINMC